MASGGVGLGLVFVIGGVRDDKWYGIAFGVLVALACLSLVIRFGRVESREYRRAWREARIRKGRYVPPEPDDD